MSSGMISGIFRWLMLIGIVLGSGIVLYSVKWRLADERSINLHFYDTYYVISTLLFISLLLLYFCFSLFGN